CSEFVHLIGSPLLNKWSLDTIVCLLIRQIFNWLTASTAGGSGDLPEKQRVGKVWTRYRRLVLQPHRNGGTCGGERILGCLKTRISVSRARLQRTRRGQIEI